MGKLKALEYTCGLGVMIVGLGLYSYYVREILASLFLFSVAFFSMSLVILSVFLAWCASKQIALWSQPASRNAIALALVEGPDLLAIGAKGRDASVDTDAYMRAEILSHSRSRGLFAGISLEGSTLRPDDDANADVYARKVTAKEIVLGGKVSIPETGRHLVEVLQKSAPHNGSKEISSK